MNATAPCFGRRAVAPGRMGLLCWGVRELRMPPMEEVQCAPPRVQTRVLIVDDDPGIGALLDRYLSGRGMQVRVVQSAGELQHELSHSEFDVLLLDLGLPDGDGLDSLRLLRARWSGPLLIISGRGESSERAIGLELGADDFIPKPFDLREVLARIHAVRRRSDAMPSRSRPFDVDGLHIDLQQRTVVGRDGGVVDLTDGEFSLLAALVQSAGTTVSRDDLMNRLHGRDAGPFDRSIDVQISRLRRKIERDVSQPRLIQSVRGTGYRMVAPRH